MALHERRDPNMSLGVLQLTGSLIPLARRLQPSTEGVRRDFGFFDLDDVTG